MQSGNYVLILHTHLPWVLHHGTWPHGEDWLTEAAAECYIPLLNSFNELMSEGILPKVSIGMSPVLCEQLKHPDFKKIFTNYCKAKIKSANEDHKKYIEWGYDPHHVYLAQYWSEWYQARLDDFNKKYDKSIVQSFRKLQDQGAIEILTCGATHGYLPLLPTEKAINMQIKLAKENYKKHFGRDPRGIWLPECAYRPSYEWHSMLPIFPYNIPKLRPGIEQFLSHHGIQYFVTDEKHIHNSRPLGYYLDNEHTKFKSIIGNNSDNYNIEKSPLKIYDIASSDKVEFGTAKVFTRHHSISMQVWSGQVGYPGEPDYLDFHKKEFGSMLRYWRVTDNKADMMYKTLYHPDWVKDKIDLQSNHFIHHIENTSNFYKNQKKLDATVCTPFDTELFGHWWFEGPQFVKAVLKGLHNSPYVKTSTCSEQIFKMQPKEVIGLPEGSWGENNNHDVWSNADNKWTWETLYNDENRLIMLFQKYSLDSLNPLALRITKQAYRELLLEQSSDWQFLIYTESAKDYSEMRFSNHHSDFNRLCDLAEKAQSANDISESEQKYLEETERRDSIFAEIDLSWWKDLEF